MYQKFITNLNFPIRIIMIFFLFLSIDEKLENRSINIQNKKMVISQESSIILLSPLETYKTNLKSDT